MKKLYLILTVVALFTAWSAFQFTAIAHAGMTAEHESPTVSTTLVLSQVDGGGGGTTGTYRNDYVEIKNISNGNQSLNGLSLYYGSASGNFASAASNAFALPNVSLLPGEFYLVQLGSAGTAGAPLPVTPDATTTNIAMGGGSGKIAIVNTSSLPINTCGATATPCTGSQLTAFVDMVVYGAAGNGPLGIGEGGNPTINNGVAILSTQGGVRKTSGCADTDNNNADFDVVTAPVPRNASSALAPCGGGSGVLQGSGNASPNVIAAGATTLLTVSVIPATSPTPSINITVHTDLSSISGSAAQLFYDDGTHGDLTPGDNVFSFSEAVPAGTSAGAYSLPVTIADQQSTANASISVTVTVASPHSAAEHETLGNPSGAMTDPIGFANDYLMEKDQYVLSYSRDRGTPNWVEWHLDASWLGSVSRQDDYREDPLLPSSWYHVQGNDYTGSPTGEGFDRGHMCPSGDRTNTVADNSALFQMTNIIPQAPINNQIVWDDLENYTRGLAQSGNELYVYSGGAGIGGTGLMGLKNTIVNGHVTVPAWTWKVIVVLPVGTNDAQRVTAFTRVISVIMPNSQSVTRPWQQYRTSVAQVEHLTGLNFLRKIRPTARVRLKKHVDTE